MPTTFPRPRRAPAPWLRSVHESALDPPPERRLLRALQLIAVIAVIAGVIAFFVWFLLLASGGPGPGTV